MKKFIATFSLIVFAFVLNACGGSEDTVKFGVIGPLTTGVSMYGESVRDGALLAAKEINENGGVLGKDLEIIAYDSKGENPEGVNAYNRLVDSDAVDALIGGTFSGVTLAIKDLAVADGLPVLTPTATHPNVTVDAPNVFRACYTDSVQGSYTAVFVSETLGFENVAVLFNRDDAYSQGLAEAFMAEYDARSLSYTAYEFGKDDDDFSAVLTNIKEGGFDAVFLPAYIGHVGPILTQAETLGLDLPFVGGDGWDGIENQYAAVAEGNYFANHYAKTDESEVVQNFVTNYTAEYGAAPDALAALAYDAVYTMAAAFEAAGSTDNAAVVAALASLTYENGVTGSISFDEVGDPIKPITMIQIVNGEHQIVTRIEESTAS